MILKKMKVPLISTLIAYVSTDTLTVMHFKKIETKKITTLKDDFEKLKVPLKSTLVAYVHKDTLSIMPLKIIETKKITTFKDDSEKNESPLKIFFGCLCAQRRFKV